MIKQIKPTKKPYGQGENIMTQVLFIEDGTDFHLTLPEFLGDRFSVTAVTNKEEAMMYIERGCFDVIITDNNFFTDRTESTKDGLGVQIIEFAQKVQPSAKIIGFSNTLPKNTPGVSRLFEDKDVCAVAKYIQDLYLHNMN